MGSFRSTPQLVKNTSVKNNSQFTYAVTHMCGWRLHMQDADLAISPLNDNKSSLFAVFDGHGGAQVATFCARHFVKQLESNSNFKNKNYQPALRETFMKMDELLMKEEGKNEIEAIQKQMRDKDNAPKYSEDSHAGCTANVVLITPEWIYCANSGDSRAVSSINSKFYELSKDHKPQNSIQLDRIKKAGGTVSFGRVNGGLNLSRAIGDFEYKKNSSLSAQQQMITANPDIQKIENKNIDFIIMGCDGIWQVKTSEEMIKWVQQRLDKKKQGAIIEELLDELVSKDSGNQYGMDNMSAILIKFEKK